MVYNLRLALADLYRRYRLREPEPSLRQLLKVARMQWRVIGLEWTRPAPADAIAEFEAYHAITLPPALRSFYQTCCELDGLNAHSDTCIWPLDALEVSHSIARDGTIFIGFADWLLCCDVYTLRIDPDGREAGVFSLGFEDRKLCADFRSFVQIMLEGRVIDFPH